MQLSSYPHVPPIATIGRKLCSTVPECEPLAVGLTEYVEAFHAGRTVICVRGIVDERPSEHSRTSRTRPALPWCESAASEFREGTQEIRQLRRHSKVAMKRTVQDMQQCPARK